MKMDCEMLIMLVQERKYLWDHRETNYHMRNVQKQLWDEVATEMNEPVELLKKKWRGLRDTYRKEFIKYTKSGSGDDPSKKPSWPYYGHLGFLSDTMKPKKTKSSEATLTEENDYIVNANDYLDEELAVEHQEDLLPASTQPAAELTTSWYHQQTPPIAPSSEKNHSNPPKKKKKSLKIENFDQKLLEIENKKVEYLERKQALNKDGDYEFLMSLLPYLHDIPKQRKLFIRQKMINILIEELNQQDSSAASPQSISHPMTDL